MPESPVDGGTDLYAVLGVDFDSTAEEIRAAYRGLAQRFHPDHNPNNMAAERRMQEINAAFRILNDPLLRREYDRRRGEGAQPEPPTPNPERGAGRGQRPYYRGNNWGIHAGAESPPEHIVRVSPAGFNLVVTAAEPSPRREVTIFNDAPFPVHLRAVPSPWLAPSLDELTIAAGSSAELTIGVALGAQAESRGWRDGGVSLVTDDPRVFSPDVRITGIFLNGPPLTRHAQTNHDGADLRAADRAGAAGDDDAPAAARGWLRRLFGG
jgi:hypothetical protein